VRPGVPDPTTRDCGASSAHHIEGATAHPRSAYDQAVPPGACVRSVHPPEGHPIPDAPSPPAKRQGGAAAWATQLTTRLGEVHAALTPILGARGVEAVLGRARQVAADAHPALRARGEPGRARHGLDDPIDRLDLVGLHAAICTLDADEAKAAGQALLGALDALLDSLVGPALTQQLLPAAPDAPLFAPPTGDARPPDTAP
jgi:hypothetical protein